ncbi:MAG: hypothetical protein ACFHX7_22000 [Pseudomonadota bacterium]
MSTRFPLPEVVICWSGARSVNFESVLGEPLFQVSYGVGLHRVMTAESQSVLLEVLEECNRRSLFVYLVCDAGETIPEQVMAERYNDVRVLWIDDEPAFVSDLLSGPDPEFLEQWFACCDGKEPAPSASLTSTQARAYAAYAEVFQSWCLEHFPDHRLPPETRGARGYVKVFGEENVCYLLRSAFPLDYLRLAPNLGDFTVESDVETLSSSWCAGVRWVDEQEIDLPLVNQSSVVIDAETKVVTDIDNDLAQIKVLNLSPATQTAVLIEKSDKTTVIDLVEVNGIGIYSELPFQTTRVRIRRGNLGRAVLHFPFRSDTVAIGNQAFFADQRVMSLGLSLMPARDSATGSCNLGFSCLPSTLPRIFTLMWLASDGSLLEESVHLLSGRTDGAWTMDSIANESVQVWVWVH